MNPCRPSIALVHHHYGPYHLARARELLRRAKGEVHLIQFTAYEALREWQLGDAVPRMTTLSPGKFEELAESKLAELLGAELDRLRPDAVVIAGYSHAAMREAARWCGRRGAASILLSDTHRGDRWRSSPKEWAKRAWVPRHFDAVFTAGAMSADYARELGFGRSRIWRGYDVVDNAFFAQGAQHVAERAARLPAELGLPSNVFLYVGRFSPEKNLERLLSAMERFRALPGALEWGLLLVGSGPEEAALRARAERSPGAVALTGFRQLDELPSIYASASALILPSVSETWGLVLNEGMACGLPILASERVGASLDLVFPGVNGYLFNPFDVEEMALVLQRFASAAVDRTAMGEASRRVIANYTPETWATALLDCVDVTLTRRRGATS